MPPGDNNHLRHHLAVNDTVNRPRNNRQPPSHPHPSPTHPPAHLRLLFGAQNKRKSETIDHQVELVLILFCYFSSGVSFSRQSGNDAHSNHGTFKRGKSFPKEGGRGQHLTRPAIPPPSLLPSPPHFQETGVFHWNIYK